MRRLTGPRRLAWRNFLALTVRREIALRRLLQAEFRRTANAAASALLSGHDPESGLGSGHERRVAQILRAAYMEGMPVFGKPIIDAGTKKSISSFEALVLGWIEQYAALKVTQITNTTRAQMRGIIGSAREEGVGTEEIARRMRRDMEFLSPVRAHTIARTETHAAANAAQKIAADSLGVDGMKREWIAAGDERTRADHAAADGQVVGLDQPFVVGGASLMHPGDPDGAPGQIINCRCTTGFIVP